MKNKFIYISTAVSVLLLVFLFYSYIWPRRSFSAPIDVGFLAVGAINLIVSCFLLRKAKRELVQSKYRAKKAQDDFVNRDELRRGIN